MLDLDPRDRDDDRRDLDVQWVQVGRGPSQGRGDEDASEVILKVKPQIIAIGDDWKDRDYLGQLGVTQVGLDDMGIEIVYLRRTTGQSSSGIRKQIRTT